MYSLIYLKELLCCFIQVNTCKSMSCVDKDVVYIAIMKHVDRHGLEDDGAYSTTLKAAEPRLDLALMRQFARLSAKGLDWQEWLAVHKGLAMMLMDRSDVTAVIAANGDFKSVSAHLGRLFKGTKTGQLVFAAPRQLLASLSLKHLFQAELNKYIESGFDTEALELLWQHVDEKIKVFHDKKGPENRTIQLELCDLTADVEVTCPRTEMQWYIWCAQKTAAVGHLDGLELYPHEKLMGLDAVDLEANGPCEVPHLT
jgi:hypothetical protein